MSATHFGQLIPLPPKHFAVLFQGAWLFTQAADKIQATCPLINDASFTHQCDVGLWVNGGFRPLPGLSPMPEGSSYQVRDLKGFEASGSDFDSLFQETAKHTPILYIPKKKVGSTSEQSAMSHSKMGSVRTVTVPLPKMIVADGILITAEIDGAGIGDAALVPGGIPRPVVTFIFVYEYCGDSATAIVAGDAQGLQVQETVTANPGQPTPHLIFRIYPYASSLPYGEMNMDDGAQKVHTTATFDTLRQTMPATIQGEEMGQSNLTPCDLSVYHARRCMEFWYGVSGLSKYELGLEKEFAVTGANLASCAAGGMGRG